MRRFLKQPELWWVVGLLIVAMSLSMMAGGWVWPLLLGLLICVWSRDAMDSRDAPGCDHPSMMVSAVGVVTDALRKRAGRSYPDLHPEALEIVRALNAAGLKVVKK